MKAICSKKECTGCAACVQACPKSCIKMSMDRNGFFYPEIDATTCVNCGRCQRICPNNIAQNKYNADFYMGWHKDLNVLKRSSSGGAFTAIADYILDNGGVVYGASFDKTTRKVSHVAISSSTQLDEIRLSKYYQSSIGNAYKHVKEDLNNKMVLFSGTACQIAGLYAYLGSKPDNLLTVDVLCHGVTSIKVIDKYISCKEKKYKKKIINFKFRLKPDDSGGGY